MVDITTLYIGSQKDHLESLSLYISKIVVVSNESEALNELTQNDYDCLLIDESMPLEEALEFITRIKMVKKSILSVIFSSNPSQSNLIHAIRIGLNNLILLPASVETISEMAKKLRFASLSNRQMIKKNLLLNQYKNALDSSINISKTNIHGLITYVNDRFCQLTEFEASEILGQTHRLFKHPDTSKEQISNLWETISAKKVWHSTLTNKTKSGKTFYSDTFIIPLLNEYHEIEEYMDMRIDVTAIYEKKHYMQQILDAQETIIVVFKDEEIIQCNRRLLEYFNLKTLEEFLNIHQCICDIVVKAPECINAEFFKVWVQNPKNKLDIKIALTRYDTEVRIFRVTKNMIETLDQDHQIIISLTDVTEMDNYRHALQSKFNLAAEEIKNQQERLITQSRSAALGEMFDNIAHQWRQPIGAINNAIINAEFALELGGMNTDEILDTFEKINTYTAFLSGTIDDFRNFSNPDKEKIWFSPHEIIRQTITIIQGSFEANTISLTYTPNDEEQLLKIYGPSGEFSQVILNILSNARDALKEHVVQNAHVIISLTHQNEFISLQIADNAGGIPQTVLPKIFDPYFSTKSKAQGTGIGLYMSKTIIEKHFEGKLEAKNEGEGAVFTIILPLKKENNI
ncbi:MAG: ATP-binding protein [Sulfuricurvum sp.]|nr:ATP-binding protein [Sulfuricurvum sp.]